jgi:acetoin utilization protein AcuB
MSQPALTCDPELTVAQAEKLMRRKGIRRLPVVKKEKLVGIVTRSDLRAAVGAKAEKKSIKKKNGKLKVGKVMTKKPVVVTRDETLEHAAQMMLGEALSGLPVVEGDEVIGVITESDIFRALCTILGFHKGGARVVLSFPKDANLLNALQNSVGRFDIQGLVCYQNPGEGAWETVIRLKGHGADSEPV